MWSKMWYVEKSVMWRNVSTWQISPHERNHISNLFCRDLRALCGGKLNQNCACGEKKTNIRYGNKHFSFSSFLRFFSSFSLEENKFLESCSFAFPRNLSHLLRCTASWFHILNLIYVTFQSFGFVWSLKASLNCERTLASIPLLLKIYPPFTLSRLSATH